MNLISPQHQVPKIKGFLTLSGIFFRRRRWRPLPKTLPFASRPVDRTSNFAVRVSPSCDPRDVQIRTLLLLDGREWGEVGVGGQCAGPELCQCRMNVHRASDQALPTRDTRLLVSTERCMVSLKKKKKWKTRWLYFHVKIFLWLFRRRGNISVSHKASQTSVFRCMNWDGCVRTLFSWANR